LSRASSGNVVSVRFRRRRPHGSLQPTCSFVIRCVGEVPATTESAPPWTVVVQDPEPDDPPEPYAASEAGRRWRGATSEIVLTLEPSDLDPAGLVTIGMELADALAAHAEGVILDPVAQRLVLPGEWRVEERLYEVDPKEHVTVHVVEDGPALWVHTHGLLKFARPELELFEVPADLSDLAYAFLMDVGGYTIAGPVIADGHTLGSPDVPLRAHDGTREREHWAEAPVLELRGDTAPTADALRAWAA
jgi:hypothetical protein